MENYKYLNNHEEYMKQALSLAEKGRGKVSPNEFPLTGDLVFSLMVYGHNSENEKQIMSNKINNFIGYSSSELTSVESISNFIDPLISNINESVVYSTDGSTFPLESE